MGIFNFKGKFSKREMGMRKKKGILKAVGSQKSLKKVSKRFQKGFKKVSKRSQHGLSMVSAQSQHGLSMVSKRSHPLSETGLRKPETNVL